MLRSFSAGVGGARRRPSSFSGVDMRRRPFGVVPNEFVVSARVQVQRMMPVWLAKARWLVLRGSKTPSLAVYRQVATGVVLDDNPLRVMLLGSDTVVQVAGEKSMVLSSSRVRRTDTWVVAFESSAQRRRMYELVKMWIELGAFLQNLAGFESIVKSNNSVIYRCYERDAVEGPTGSCPPRRQYALKRMSKAKSWDEIEVTERALAIEGLQPYLARYLYMYETCEDQSVTIVMKYYSGGSLADRIRAGGALPEKVAKGVVSSLCCALYSLHQHGILHLDVKTANILFDSDSARAFTNLKLVDFGGSTLRPRSYGGESTEEEDDEDEEGADGDAAKLRQRKAVGTYGCMAPERFDGRYGPEADVYGAGVVLYHMIVGDVPFPGSDPYQVMVKNMQGDVSFANPKWRRVSTPLRRLAERMLDKEPATRITIPEILKTRWLFQNLSDHEILVQSTPSRAAAAESGPARRAAPSASAGVRSRGASDCNVGSDYYSRFIPHSAKYA
ncbi:hypothetical protein PybrP1_006067 [[Pythium] brassicae (nom. inval.)]|nr:hypothetical protein PybrP1_006067 [[Pythium] brassicae (nom. inval.)]